MKFLDPGFNTKDIEKTSKKNGDGNGLVKSTMVVTNRASDRKSQILQVLHCKTLYFQDMIYLILKSLIFRSFWGTLPHGPPTRALPWTNQGPRIFRFFTFTHATMVLMHKSFSLKFSMEIYNQRNLRNDVLGLSGIKSHIN